MEKTLPHTNCPDQHAPGFICLDQPSLVNLSQALSNEFLSTNHSGGYMCTTVALCNTRKYHGLMVLPLEHFDGERHVLLSTLDETLSVGGQEFHLAVRRYPGIYEPRGHKYLMHFSLAPTPTFIYRVGDVVLEKELLFVEKHEHFMVRYTLLEGKGSVSLRIRPFLAFRNAHALCHANMVANTKARVEPNGISMRLYAGFPTLYLQTNIQGDYVHAPDWYYQIEYSEEQARGYESHEDLLVPGYFDVPTRRGGSMIFSACTRQVNPRVFARLFKQELASRPDRTVFLPALKASADQFIAHDGRKVYVNAGYPWFGPWGRDTLIALPGLTLTLGDTATFEHALTTLLGGLRHGMLPNMGSGRSVSFNSVDAPLWLFAAVQAYCRYTGDYRKAWSAWGKQVEEVFSLLQTDGQLPYDIGMRANGLLWAGKPGYALTWMDAIVNGQPVTPRIGYDVEVNALWYNALCFMQELYAHLGQAQQAASLSATIDLVRSSFVQVFWCPEKGYLADYVDAQGANVFVRPNQLFAVSLPYSPLSEEQQAGVVDTVERELFTPLGLRTLSPRNPSYRPHYAGDQPTRDAAYHQGTVWPWLLGPYVEAVYRVRGAQAGLANAKRILSALEQEMHRYGLAQIGEVLDGDPPHRPGGSIAQAWSVAAALEVAARVYPQEFHHPLKPKKGGR